MWGLCAICYHWRCDAREQRGPSQATFFSRRRAWALGSAGDAAGSSRRKVEQVIHQREAAKVGPNRKHTV